MFKEFIKKHSEEQDMY